MSTSFYFYTYLSMFKTEVKIFLPSEPNFLFCLFNELLVRTSFKILIFKSFDNALIEFVLHFANKAAMGSKSSLGRFPKNNVVVPRNTNESEKRNDVIALL